MTWIHFAQFACGVLAGIAVCTAVQFAFVKIEEAEQLKARVQELERGTK